MNNQKRKRVLIVDDVLANIKVLDEILRPFYDVSIAMNGQDALKIAGLPNGPDLILLDIMMPGMDGYKVCHVLKNNPNIQNIPVLFVTAMGDVEDETKGLSLGAVDYITKPISPPIVLARVRNHMSLHLHQEHLEELVIERTKELSKTQDVTILSMATLAEYRDPETGGHIKRTQNYVRLLAEHLQNHPNYQKVLNQEGTIELLFKSAPLHDIGKVGVRDEILLKPGKLTAEEFDEMKLHTVYGHNAIKSAEEELGSNSFLRYAGEIASSHHEKWDGTGYPQGNAGDDIPVSGRIMAIADVYDALISKRVYKLPFPHSKAVGIIADGKGRHFDPDMTDVFLELEEPFRQIALKYAEHDEEKIALAG